MVGYGGWLLPPGLVLSMTLFVYLMGLFHGERCQGFMISGNLKSSIEHIWGALWSGGIAGLRSVAEPFGNRLSLTRLDRRCSCVCYRSADGVLVRSSWAFRTLGGC